MAVYREYKKNKKRYIVIIIINQNIHKQLTECRLKLSHIRSFPGITHACFYIIIKPSSNAQ
jgi:rRNA pseudouridine-1189 N-methylase Emg1 (Nep1/Mra1 family)